MIGLIGRDSVVLAFFALVGHELLQMSTNEQFKVEKIGKTLVIILDGINLDIH